MSLGTFRYILALLVLMSHLWLQMPQGFAAYAVWGFFLLSGFLMTYVLSVKYKFSIKGISHYLYNRALRIYPLYWIAFIVGIIGMHYLDSIGSDYMLLNSGFGEPDSLYKWLCNIFLLPDYYFNNPVPVANALRIEVFYYFVVILFAYNKKYAWGGFGIGVIWNLYLLYQSHKYGNDTFPERYATIGPCSIAFAAGSLLFHYKEHLMRFSNKYLSLLAWFGNGLIWFVLPNYPWSIGLYISLGFSAWVVVSFYEERSSKIDQLLGDLSYPIYLLHTTLGAICVPIVGEFRTFTFMVIAALLTHLMCLIFVWLIDQQIRKLKV